MAKKNDPIAWVQELVKKHGIEPAYNIVNTNRAEFIGHDKDVRNPYSPWYQRAYQWLTKNHPLPQE